MPITDLLQAGHQHAEDVDAGDALRKQKMEMQKQVDWFDELARVLIVQCQKHP